MNEEDCWDDYHHKLHVLVNGEKIYNDDPDLEIINIEEDIQGYDVVTFEYKKQTYKSRVYS